MRAKIMIISKRDGCFLALCVLAVACRDGGSRVAPGSTSKAAPEALSATSAMEERIAFVHDGDVIDTYDYVVRLTNDSNEVQCGGIAVAPNFVLTAAHCVPLATRVFAPGATSPRFVSIRFCHPQFQETEPRHQNARNDLALLRVDDSLGGSSWPLSRVAGPAGTGLYVMGWGKPQTGSNPDLIRSKAMSLQGDSACEEWWRTNGGQEVDAEEFCAGAAASSACKGDSGGPLFNGALTGTNLEFTQLVGILSKADDACDAAGVFDIYTRIDTAWINDIIGQVEATRRRSTCS